MSEEEKMPYLIENKERDTFTIYVKGTKPYLDLQKRNQELEDGFKSATDELCEYATKIDKAIEYIKEQLSQGGERELRDLVDGYELLEILGDKENE